jgi:uncharacterized protein (DUF2252 family)
LFDLNDFDETAPGPFAWHVKRLAASLEIAGRGNGFKAKERRATVLAAAASYRESMRGFDLVPEASEHIEHIAPAVRHPRQTERRTRVTRTEP